MTYLYGGTILKIDLTDKTIAKEPTSSYVNKYMGGRGINARLLYEEVGPEVKPLDPENVIVFGIGPLTGTLFPGTSRTDIMAKSPVTKLLGNANMGGDWAAEVKFAGYDNIALKGKSERPIYIFIDNDEVLFKNAVHIWGKDTYETHNLILDEIGDPEVKVISIGPAGENLVTYATIHCNLGNAAARTGMGAVLGSKNVKAVVVRGTKGVRIADPGGFFEACKEAHDAIKANPFYQELHTSGSTKSGHSWVSSGVECGGDEFKTAPHFDSEGKTNSYDFWNEYGLKRTGCCGCPVQCMESYHVPGLGATVMSCGLYLHLTWNVRNKDMRLWYESITNCQKSGLDETSMATILSWLMILYEEGIISKEHTDGIAMKWGSPDAILGMIHRIVRREGFGNVLADGIEATARKLDRIIPAANRKNRSTKYFAMQINNNPMTTPNPRFSSTALGYAIGRRSDIMQDLDISFLSMLCAASNPELTEKEKERIKKQKYDVAEKLTGIKEAADPYSYKGKAAVVSDMGMTTGVTDIVGACKWHTKWYSMDIGLDHYAKALSSGLGESVTPDDLTEASLRVRNLERAYECREGRRRKHDTIPEKEFNNFVTYGHWKGKISLDPEGFEQMKDDYYTIRGWDLTTGVPTEETLEKYQLEDIAKDLKNYDIL